MLNEMILLELVGLFCLCVFVNCHNLQFAGTNTPHFLRVFITIIVVASYSSLVVRTGEAKFQMCRPCTSLIKVRPKKTSISCESSSTRPSEIKVLCFPNNILA